MFISQSVIVIFGDSRILHTSDSFSYPACQSSKSLVTCREIFYKIINCSSDDSVQMYNNFAVKIVRADSNLSNFIFKFLNSFLFHFTAMMVYIESEKIKPL
jgi:hypothetical protein